MCIVLNIQHFTYYLCEYGLNGTYRYSPTETEGKELFPRILNLRERSLCICMCVSQPLPRLARNVYPQCKTAACTRSLWLFK